MDVGILRGRPRPSFDSFFQSIEKPTEAALLLSCQVIAISHTTGYRPVRSTYMTCCTHGMSSLCPLMPLPVTTSTLLYSS